LNGGSLYIKNISAFSKIVKPHILHSQYYLLNTPVVKLNLFGARRTSVSLCSTKRSFSTNEFSDAARAGSEERAGRPIRSKPPALKCTNNYKKEYELSIEQKEAQSSPRNENLLNPFFVSGFCDAEGCFTISVIKNNSNLGWTVKQRSFQIKLHEKDLERRAAVEVRDESTDAGRFIKKNSKLFWCGSFK
jgi:hypothetical protein